MANYSVSASQLTEGRNIFIRGKLAFARLTRLIEGAELAASDQRKIQNGMSPIGKPHTTATITEAEVESADPANPTVEEAFVAERRYASKKNPDTGLHYSIDSKGTSLPVIVIPSGKDDGTYDQDTSGQELAQGVDVTLVLRTFKPKNFNNRGLALEQVIVHGKPVYYNGGGVDTNELAARGIVLNSPPRQLQAAEATPAGDAQAVPVGSDDEDGLSFPAPQPAAAPGEVQDPAAAATAVAAPAASETLEEKLARLQAENESLKDAGSPVGAAAGPWAGTVQPQQAGIHYQG
ncbi:hypothetical protein ACFRAU_07265 [Arthrobacter sp. NPDC056691]|uniref:hypothetical protein n=1 Tax=Arthrobacter sp. NPDC056691 TaxID=3345913 RepID=UPI0036705ABB